jgi:multicomponent K+:H+ antiporter subunit E
MRDSTRVAGRRFPPLLVGALLLIWLLMNQTLSFGEVVLGAVLAAGVAWASAALRPLQPRLKRVHVAARLAAVVLLDILRSNIGVARVVLGLTGGKVRSGFVEIPLDMRDPHGLAVLAIIVTSTPGTVWVGLSADGSRLTLHVLDFRDEADWIDWIKNRYERPLMSIFE